MIYPRIADLLRCWAGQCDQHTAQPKRSCYQDAAGKIDFQALQEKLCYICSMLYYNRVRDCFPCADRRAAALLAFAFLLRRLLLLCDLCNNCSRLQCCCILDTCKTLRIVSPLFFIPPINVRPQPHHTIKRGTRPSCSGGTTPQPATNKTKRRGDTPAPKVPH